MWCKISAFSSNLAITTCQTLMPGQTITGIIGATYGTHLTAQLEAWKPCDWRGWDKMSDHPAPDWEDIDLNPHDPPLPPSPRRFRLVWRIITHSVANNDPIGPSAIPIKSSDQSTVNCLMLLNRQPLTLGPSPSRISKNGHKTTD